jgi:hypothetical protein
MYNAFMRSLRGSIVILLLAFMVGLALQVYKSAVPEQVERNTINITQTDLAQARARWDASKIDVYEITGSDLRVSARLRVDRATGDIYLLQLTIKGQSESVDGLSAPVSGVAVKVYQAYTIDAVYDSITGTLAAVTAGQPSANGGESSTFHDYDVQLDPSGTYPIRFAEDVRTTLSPREITWRTSVRDLQIKDFTEIP